MKTIKLNTLLNTIEEVFKEVLENADLYEEFAEADERVKDYVGIDPLDPAVEEFSFGDFTEVRIQVDQKKLVKALREVGIRVV